MEQISSPTLIKKQIQNMVKELNKLKKIKGSKKISKNLKNDLTRQIERLSQHVESSLKNHALNCIPVAEKMFTTMGLEYTFLRPKDLPMSHGDVIKKLTAMSDKRQGWNKKFHQDGEDVVECAGPVHNNWNELITYYRQISGNATKLGLTTKNDVSGSGGCHIHMGIPKNWKTDFRLRFLRTLFLDITARPYLNWIFNESIDHHNANSLLTSEAGVKFILQTYGGEDINPRVFESDHSYGRGTNHMNFDLMQSVNSKSYAVRYDSEYDTMEFRIFDMVDNEGMLEDYVEFANAYFRYIYYKTKEYDGNSFPRFSYFGLDKKCYEQFKDPKIVIQDFNELINQLGLNPANYKKYIKMNYMERLELAKVGDVKMDYDIIENNPWPKIAERPKQPNVRGRDIETLWNSPSSITSANTSPLIPGRDIPLEGDAADAVRAERTEVVQNTNVWRSLDLSGELGDDGPDYDRRVTQVSSTNEGRRNLDSVLRENADDSGPRSQAPIGYRWVSVGDNSWALQSTETTRDEIVSADLPQEAAPIPTAASTVQANSESSFARNVGQAVSDVISQGNTFLQSGQISNETIEELDSNLRRSLEIIRSNENN